MKRIFAFLVFLILLVCSSKAQKPPSFYPFKGFHVGITGQAQFIQKSNYISLGGTDPAPRARWASGWETGIEFSYHFAKYFGIAVGINIGTVLSNKAHAYFNAAAVNYPGSTEDYFNEPHTLFPFPEGILFPIKLQLHYPLHKNLFFTAEAGVKIRGIEDWIGLYKKYGFWYRSYTYDESFSWDNEEGGIETRHIYHEYGEEDITKVHCDLLLGIGLYYRLPHGDLIRFMTGVNISFRNTVEGYYYYPLTKSFGTFSAKHDFIYTQLSYIHTFNWEKAKKYLKKNDYSFATKKERRKKIVEVLGNW